MLQDDTTGFAQLTVRIPSQQRFAAYDRQGRLVAGDPERAIEVEDFWVFEHSLKKSPANRWRLAGRLAIQPAAAAEPMLPPGAAPEPLQPQQKAACSQKQRVATAEAAAAMATAAAAGGTEPPRAGNLREQQRVSRQQQWGEQRAGKRKAAAARGRR